jgi:hypothetical protein
MFASGEAAKGLSGVQVPLGVDGHGIDIALEQRFQVWDASGNGELAAGLGRPLREQIAEHHLGDGGVGFPKGDKLPREPPDTEYPDFEGFHAVSFSRPFVTPGPDGEGPVLVN